MKLFNINSRQVVETLQRSAKGERSSDKVLLYLLSTLGALLIVGVVLSVMATTHTHFKKGVYKFVCGQYNACEIRSK